MASVALNLYAPRLEVTVDPHLRFAPVALRFNGDSWLALSADEAAVKRPLVSLCRQTIAVLDATKWGRVGLASFAELTQVNTIVTDRGAPETLVNQVRSLGCEVTIV